MGLELLFLLLPVAFVAGWWLAHRKRPDRAEFECAELPADYLKGLNYLLNEQPDKAIQVFIDMLEVDSETVETHLALGSLFRRRGEVDRSIRIHQNLIARPTLTRAQRAQALFELGQDYMRAGLFDRAETLFSELIDSSPHTEAALRYLIDIYQQEKDWDKAIEAAQRLETRSGEKLNAVIAQYYCELAEQDEKHSEPAKASKLVRRALAVDRDCVRASLAEARLAMNAGDYKGAIRAFRRVEQQDPEYLPEVIAPMQECFRQLGRPDEIQGYLENLEQKHGGISTVLALADLLDANDGAQASDYITEHLRKRPSVRGMDRLIELQLRTSDGAGRDNLQLLKGMTEQLLDNKPIYSCSHCGFTGKTLHWQCPGCKHWNTVKPIHGVEGE